MDQQRSIVVYSGDDFADLLEFMYEEDSSAMDITGWLIYFTVKKHMLDGDSAAVIAVTVSPSDPTNGIAVVEVDKSITKDLLGLYYFDYKVKRTDDKVQTIVSGGITFLASATKRSS